ncbi:hypothetical protein HK104_002224 [Borealophlyctis nickersoniae]|nr:hypothetical protein HK104_002224 [Borealophlyctis nickersoniae]
MPGPTKKSGKTPSSRKRKATSKSDTSVEQVRQLAKECLESTTNLNNIVELLDLCESEHPEVAHAATVSLHHVYSKLSERGDLKRPKNEGGGSGVAAKSNVANWLRENRQLFINLLLKSLTGSEPSKQIVALQILLGMVKHESENIGDFDNNLFQRVVDECVGADELGDHLLELLVQNINNYDDIRYYFYKDFGKFLQSAVSTSLQPEETRSKRRKVVDPTKLSSAVKNGIEILTQINDPAKDAEELGNCLITLPAQDAKTGAMKTNFALQVAAQRTVFTECWLAFMRQPMTVDVYKRILVMLHKKIIPFMAKPTLLIDFLVDAYDAGGPVSLLALNGLFTLITKHNLDYPDFYTKLYALFDRNLMHVKYRSRFFRLVDLFLSSSQLPSYLVAAFIKRMSRLSLTAPPAGILILIPLIYNLLKRHPSCIRLIHVEGEVSRTDAVTDPYNFDEPDLAKCGAMESCLWELQTLKNHYLPSVSGLARIFEESLAKPEYDLEDFLDHSYNTLFESETKKKRPEEGAAAPLAIHAKVVGMFDKLPADSLWVLP